MSQGDVRTAAHVADTERPLVVDLNDAVAIDPTLTGGKAAALARGRTAGLASLPGVVLTTAFCNAIDAGADVATHSAVREAFDRADGDQQALVARSSSVVEDMATSSMAGQFESIIGVRGFEVPEPGGFGVNLRRDEPSPIGCDGQAKNGLLVSEDASGLGGVLGREVPARVPGKGKLKVIEAAPGTYARIRADGK